MLFDFFHQLFSSDKTDDKKEVETIKTNSKDKLPSNKKKEGESFNTAKNVKKQKIPLVSETQEIIKTDNNDDLAIFPLSDIKSEVNFLHFPFFILGRKNLKTKPKIEYKDVIVKDDQKLEISWQVLATTDYGLPGSFDKKVHKAIEQIINQQFFQQKIPVQNPISFSIYQLCKIIEIAPEGHNVQMVKQALKRMVATTIDSVGTFYHKDEKKRLNKVFHLYDQIIFKEEELANGELADTNYLFLSDVYTESLNAFYVKPIDFQYYRSLESPLAGRLYELLGLRFYGSKKYGYVWFEYPKLCRILPITQQKSLSNAQQNLSSAHKKLIDTGFLEKAEWSKAKDGKTFIITYYPGQKAIQELKKADEKAAGFEQMSIPQLDEPDKTEQKEIKKEPLPEKPSEPPAPTQEEEGIDLSDIDIKAELQRIGVLSSKIDTLTQQYPHYQIAKAILIYNDQKKRGTTEKLTNPAGHVIRLIEKNEPLPKRLIEEYEEQRITLDRIRRHEERQEQEQRYNQYVKTHIDEFINNLSEEELNTRKDKAKNIFLKKFPQARAWGKDTLDKTISSTLRDEIRKDLSLPEINDWIQQQNKTQNN